MRELQINEQIRDREVLVIDIDGTQHGVMPIRDARQLAEDKGLDLCKVSAPGVQPATCKLMNYGKYRYELQKKEKEAKKKQVVVETKEIRLSAVIDVGDIDRLAEQSATFLKANKKVKASIRLKGRQQAHPEIALKIVEGYVSAVAEKYKAKSNENVIVEKKPVQDGRMIFTILAPVIKK